MFPDAKWLEALKLPLRVMLGVALSSGALLLLNRIGVLDLDGLHKLVWPIVMIVFIVSSVLSLVGIVDLLLVPFRERRHQTLLAARRAVRRKELEDERAQREAVALSRLDHLSKEELHYVARCLRDGSPTFYAYVHSPPLSAMQGKHLLWTPGGPHHQDHYPFSFPEFVWEALLARKDEFIAKDDEHKRAEKDAKEAKRRQHF